MARTSVKARKPPRSETENNSTQNNTSKEEIEGNKSENKAISDQIEIYNKEDDGLTHEEDKVIDSSVNDEKTQYLVRWQGHKKVNDDTWENKFALKSCSVSLAAFKQRNMRSSLKKKIGKRTSSERNKTLKKGIEKSGRSGSFIEGGRSQNKRKNKTAKRAKSSSRKKIKQDAISKECLDKDSSEESDNESTDGINYEVEKIIEMRKKKNGSREFLIRWKGYNPGRDTWEPEGHLNCRDMIQRFIGDISKIKDQKEEELQELKNIKTVVPVAKGSGH